MAKLCEQYDVTISDVDPDVRCLLEVIVPRLSGHALWLLGEIGKGKTPLGRILSMMFFQLEANQVLQCGYMSCSQAQEDLPLQSLVCLRLAKLFKGVNMSAAEQVFRWLRNYAKLLNEIRAL